MNAPQTPKPTLSLTPRHRAVADHAGATLDVLVRITAPPPSPGAVAARPPLHLALVIDRSGSMSGQPLTEAWRAARHVVEGLGPRDKAALITFHDEPETLVPLVGAQDRGQLLQLLSRPIRSAGSTNLHGGWLTGAEALAAEAAPDILSRVILLSDGAANRGLTDIGELQEHCAELAAAHVSTSTCGLSRGFNEELLVGMARAGQGNSYYGQTAEDLLDPFQQELSLLNALCARQLVLRAQASPGITLRLLNGYAPQGPDGWHLPDLALGGEAWALFQLTLPAAGAVSSEHAFSVFLDYRDLDAAPQRADTVLLPLPRVPRALAATLPEDDTVAARVREMEIADLQQQARTAARHRDWDTVGQLLYHLRDHAGDRPDLQAMVSELQALHDRRDEEMFSKEALYADRRLRERLLAREDLAVAEAASHFRLKGSQGKAEPFPPARPMRPPAQVTVVGGDLTVQPDCQAIVNSADRTLHAGGGVCGAIHRAAGPALALHCQGLGPVDTGDCVLTPGFGLPNRYVLHTVVPGYTAAGEATLRRLSRCLEAVIEKADRHGMERIAVPALGLGARGYPADQAIPTLVRAAWRMARKAAHLQEIRFVAANAVTLAGFEAVLAGGP